MCIPPLKGRLIFDIGFFAAKEKSSELMCMIKSGKEATIRSKGKRIAKIIPLKQKPAKRMLGAARGKVIIKGDFNMSLPKAVEEKFYK